MPGLGQRKIFRNPLNDKFVFTAISKSISLDKIEEALTKTNKHSERERLMPATLTVYYVLALAFYGQVSSREVLRLLINSLKGLFIRDQKPIIATKSAISQARSKLARISHKHSEK